MKGEGETNPRKRDGIAAESMIASTDTRPAGAPFWLVPTLVCLLILSGICALVYQVLWLRLLALTFGVTTHAASTVLASFMGGLALGSFVAGRLADRVRHPLRLFGLVELSIGLCALATPTALAGVHRLYVAVFPHLPESLAIATAVRFALSFAVLLVPTALMGATLPIVVKSSVARIDRIGTRIGVLYASNTAGAIVGALLAGFYLVPHIGLTRSFLLAACVNAIVGVIAVTTSRYVRAIPLADIPAPAAEATVFPRVSYVVLAVFAVSGFASLALEVIWFRVLIVFLGPTTYAFTLMLASVLAGIAVGSAIVAPVMRLRIDWLQVLAVLQMGAAVVAVQSFSTLRRAARVPDWLSSLAAWPGSDFLLPAAVSTVVAIFPTAVFLGLAFPVGLRLWAGTEPTERHTAERIGVFYSLNVCGGIVGSIVAGFVLLPELGSRGSLIAVSALFLLSGLVVQAALARRRPALTVLVAGGAVFVFAVQAQSVSQPLDMARRRFHSGAPALWHEEGIQTTVTVVGGPGTGNRVMFLDGRHQADDSASMIFIHRRIGALPAVLHPRPRRALVVGLGGGVTPGALSQFPGLQVDIVELSESVVRGAAFFSHVNFDVLHRGNVRAHLDDGRNFLLRTRTQYDVITADAILPHHAGANNVNSVGYFRLVRDALAPDGVALHWNGGATGTEFKLILRAFVAAFPDATLWGDGSLMVGTRQPLTLSRGRIEAMLNDPVTREVLALMHVESFDHLQRMFRASPADIRAFVGEGPILTDDKPAIEYFASLPQDERALTRIGRDPTAVIRP